MAATCVMFRSRRWI